MPGTDGSSWIPAPGFSRRRLEFKPAGVTDILKPSGYGKKIKMTDSELLLSGLRVLEWAHRLRAFGRVDPGRPGSPM